LVEVTADGKVGEEPDICACTDFAMSVISTVRERSRARSRPPQHDEQCRLLQAWNRL